MSKTFYNAKNLRLKNGFARNPDRYYLEEYFEQLPKHDLPKFSATLQDGTETSSTNETVLEKLEIPRRSLAPGDVIHITGMAIVTQKNANESLKIIIDMTQKNDLIGTETDGISIAESNDFNLSMNDIITIDMYIIVKLFQVNISDRPPVFIDKTDFNIHGTINIDGTQKSFNVNDLGDSSDFIENILCFNFKNKWNGDQSTNNKIRARTFITELNGTRIDNKNFIIETPSNMFNYPINDNDTGEDMKFYNENVDISYTDFDINNTGIRLITRPSGTREPTDDKNIPTARGVNIVPSPNSSWYNSKIIVKKQFEWECAVSYFGNVYLRVGLTTNAGDRDGANTNTFRNKSDNNVSDQIEFVFDEGKLSIKIFISYVLSTSITNINLTEGKVYKLRISVDGKRFPRFFINDIQYNISSSGTNDVTEGYIISKSRRLNESTKYIPFLNTVSIINSNNNTEENIPKVFLHYMKVSQLV